MQGKQSFYCPTKVSVLPAQMHVHLVDILNLDFWDNLLDTFYSYFNPASFGIGVPLILLVMIK